MQRWWVMRHRWDVAAIILAVLVISRPGVAAENWPDSVDQNIAQIRKTIDTTDVDGYLAITKNPGGALLLDVREANEFKAGHVPGALNIARGTFPDLAGPWLSQQSRYEPQDIHAVLNGGAGHPRGQATQGYRLH
jgi:rhodanese-related sulfurtransferase